MTQPQGGWSSAAQSVIQADRREPLFHVAWHGPLGTVMFGWVAYSVHSLPVMILSTLYALVTACGFVAITMRDDSTHAASRVRQVGQQQ